ncbi:MAG: magnesium transporter [Deltaproteobacteria bacterium]|nr:magnesium transporter [Deltaproteobacteria bacterium]
MRLSTLLRPDIEDVLRNNPEEAAAVAEELPPADLAETIESLDDGLAVRWLGMLSRDVAVKALDHMDPTRRVELFSKLDRVLAADLAADMSSDDRADMFQNLEPELRSDVLGRMPGAESRDIRDLIQYPENTAGGIMTTDFVALSAEWTVEKAIEEIRRTAEETETVYEVFAVDPYGTLVGSVSLRDLLFARGAQLVSAIMNSDAVSVPAEKDQEEVAQIFQRYDLLALPVVDSKRKLLGIVTVDDVVDVIKEEQAEDIQKLGAVRPTEGTYFQTDFYTFLRSRAVWLIVLFIGQTFTVGLLKRYEGVVSAATFVAFFIPLIISSAGNTGNQAASLVIRGMALGEFTTGDAFRILWRETRIGLALGGILAMMGLITSLVLASEGGAGLAFSVAISLVSCVTIGSVAGAGLPLFIRRIGFDPALASGPFIASMLDVIGIVIYVQTAIWLMGL